MENAGDRGRERLDVRLDQARRLAPALQPPPKGWIRAIRDGLGMSRPQLARRLRVSPQNVEQVEKSETSGSIQISTLRKVAEAMNATLIYAVVPNEALEKMVYDRARAIAVKALARVSHTMRLEDQEAAAADLEFRIERYVRDELRGRDLWSEA